MDPYAFEIEELRRRVLILTQMNERLHHENCELRAYIQDLTRDDTSSDWSDNGVPDPPIFRLSEEILTMIVDSCDDWVGDLMELRFVHPRFAYLDIVMKRLFREVWISPKQCMVEPSLIKIAPYARKVHFYPAVIDVEVQCEYQKSDPRYSDAMHYATERALAPWCNALGSGETSQSITEVLKSLPKAESFTIHEDIDGSYDRGKRFPKRSGIFRLALQSLARSGLRPKELTLHFDHFHDGSGMDPVWLRTPASWSGLDLSNLRALHFDGSLSMSTDQNHQPDILPLLSKSAPFLQEAYFDVLGMSLCLQPVAIDMPALRKIDVFDTNICLPNFADWIGRCAALQELAIKHDYTSDCGLEVEGEFIATFNVWRPLFTCIRNHASKMRLKWDPLSVQNWADPPLPGWSPEERHVYLLFFVDHDTADACHDSSFRRTGDHEKDGKCEAVINYMSNAGEWTLDIND